MSNPIDQQLSDILHKHQNAEVDYTSADAKSAIKQLIVEARKFEIEQAIIVAETENMTIEYMQEALNRRLATLKERSDNE